MLIIGELINATRKSVREAVINHDREFIQDLARKQDEAGADYIDVNVATGSGKSEKEIEDMKWAVELIKEVTEKPLTIDTTSKEVLESGLKAYGPGAMLNSISAESGRLEPFLELARQYECPIIALPATDKGIPKDVEGRLQVATEILERAEKMGFAKESFYFDPLAFPLGVDDKSGEVTLESLRRFREELCVKTTIGLTNISHGLPQRALLNRTYLVLAMGVGLDSALLNPLDKAVMSSVSATLALTGQDPYCGKYLRAFRKGDLVV